MNLQTGQKTKFIIRIDELVKSHVIEVYNTIGRGDPNRTARLLGISRSSIYRYLKKYRGEYDKNKTVQSNQKTISK